MLEHCLIDVWQCVGLYFLLALFAKKSPAACAAGLLLKQG
jgi:hypothetical protein